MPYRDTSIVCTKCGKEFVFRVEEQRRQAEQGKEIIPPELCPACNPNTDTSHHREPQRESQAELSKEQKTEATIALGPGPHEGTVKWFDREKGYGFIAHSDGTEIFFHRSGIAPEEGLNFPDDTPVTFIIEQTEKGPQAVDVAHMNEGANTRAE
jgi:CspA family cold shock protein